MSKIERRAVSFAPALLGLCVLLAPGCDREPESAPPESGAQPASAVAAPLAPRTGFMETGELPIDRIYHSMEGPLNRIQVDYSNLQWVTAIHGEVIDASTSRPMGDEFFCHSQLQLLNGTRLLVLATGADDIRFPPGFAMPVAEMLAMLPAEQRSLTYLGMVLNNYEPVIDKRARVRATLEFYLDEDFGSHPRPRKLYPANLTMFVKDLEEYVPDDPALVSADVTTHCALVGKLPVHWMVPPGKQKTRYRYTGFAPDSRVHYAWVHMHNYGEYMRLTDVTTGEMLWQADVKHEAARAQIASISHYSSTEGFPLYHDHEYEIEAVYDNTTDHDIDAMAMMMLYFNPLDNVSLTFPFPPGE